MYQNTVHSGETQDSDSTYCKLIPHPIFTVLASAISKVTEYSTPKYLGPNRISLSPSLPPLLPSPSILLLV